MDKPDIIVKRSYLLPDLLDVKLKQRAADEHMRVSGLVVKVLAEYLGMEAPDISRLEMASKDKTKKQQTKKAK
ncbi:MAG: hypothetical protein WA667_06880 [Candidatus Nitrosopolaris sp.]